MDVHALLSGKLKVRTTNTVLQTHDACINKLLKEIRNC